MSAYEKRRETTAGLFILIGLILLGVLIVEFGKFNDRFTDHYPLYIEFSDSSGIIKGSDVRLRGAKIGTVVTNPKLVTSGLGGSIVRIEVRIRNDVKIPHNSTIKIGSSGIMGDSFIQIIPPEKETGIYYKPGDTISGAASGGFDAIRNNAEAIAREANQRLIDAKTTLKKMDESLIEIRLAAKNLNIALQKVNSGLLSKQNLNNASIILANFKSSSEEIKSATQKIQPLIREASSTIASIHQASDSANSLIINAQREIQHIEPALRDIPKAVRSITKVAQKTEKTIDSLQTKNSLFDTVTTDQETGYNTKEFI